SDGRKVSCRNGLKRRSIPGKPAERPAAALWLHDPGSNLVPSLTPKNDHGAVDRIEPPDTEAGVLEEAAIVPDDEDRPAQGRAGEQGASPHQAGKARAGWLRPDEPPAPAVMATKVAADKAVAEVRPSESGPGGQGPATTGGIPAAAVRLCGTGSAGENDRQSQ